MLSSPNRIRTNGMVIAVVWSVLLAGSFAWFYYELKEDVLVIARIEARMAYEKDVFYRRWAASLGSMYVPVGPHSPPKDQPVRWHVTSLKLINPENAPDSWETLALQTLEKGVTEVSEVWAMNQERFRD